MKTKLNNFGIKKASLLWVLELNTHWTFKEKFEKKSKINKGIVLGFIINKNSKSKVMHVTSSN